jgi:hypothetical protein
MASIWRAGSEPAQRSRELGRPRRSPPPSVERRGPPDNDADSRRPSSGEGLVSASRRSATSRRDTVRARRSRRGQRSGSRSVGRWRSASPGTSWPPRETRDTLPPRSSFSALPWRTVAWGSSSCRRDQPIHRCRSTCVSATGALESSLLPRSGIVSTISGRPREQCRERLAEATVLAAANDPPDRVAWCWLSRGHGRQSGDRPKISGRAQRHLSMDRHGRESGPCRTAQSRRIDRASPGSTLVEAG